MKNILILGSLPEDEKSKQLYTKLISILTRFTENISSPLDTTAFKGGDRERYTRAFEKVKEADLIIGELSSPSTGQGMELREAISLEKKLIIIAKAKSKVSGLVRGCPAVKEIIFYRNMDDLQEKLELAFEKV